MPKKIPSMFPRGKAGQTWLYLIGTKPGTVKVGRTSRPRMRISTHRVDLAGNLAWCHLFACSGNAEYGAIRALAEKGTRIRKTESFSGLSKEEAIAIVREYIAERAVDALAAAKNQRHYIAYHAALKEFQANYRDEAA